MLVRLLVVSMAFILLRRFFLFGIVLFTIIVLIIILCFFSPMPSLVLHLCFFSESGASILTDDFHGCEEEEKSNTKGNAATEGQRTV